MNDGTMITLALFQFRFTSFTIVCRACNLDLGHCVSSRNVGARRSLKNCESHIDASHSRQPLVKGERLVRYEVNAVMHMLVTHSYSLLTIYAQRCFYLQFDEVGSAVLVSSADL